MTGFLTVNEIAARLSRAPSSVRDWAAAGLLKGAVKHGRDWLIPAAALDGFTPPRRGPKAISGSSASKRFSKREMKGNGGKARNS